jgi:hypothetical protein
MGQDGIVIGEGGGALGFTTIELPAGGARVGSTFRLANAREGETRSQAYFFQPRSADGSSGLLGLPVAKFLEGADRPYLGSSAAILFLARRDRQLSELGELSGAATAGTDRDDGCQASCVDWYGNARPIFIGDRLFALLGYELVEGAVRDGAVREVGRTSFAPAPPAAEK